MRLILYIIGIKIFFILISIISNNIIDQKVFEIKELETETEYAKERYLEVLGRLNELKNHHRVDSLARSMGLEWFDQKKLKMVQSETYGSSEEK